MSKNILNFTWSLLLLPIARFIMIIMQSLSDDEQRGVLGEVLADQLQVILEYVQVIPSMQQQLRTMNERLSDVEYMMKVHEVDIKQIRRQLAWILKTPAIYRVYLI